MRVKWKWNNFPPPGDFFDRWNLDRALTLWIILALNINVSFLRACHSQIDRNRLLEWILIEMAWLGCRTFLCALVLQMESLPIFPRIIVLQSTTNHCRDNCWKHNLILVQLCEKPERHWGWKIRKSGRENYSASNDARRNKVGNSNGNRARFHAISLALCLCCGSTK